MTKKIRGVDVRKDGGASQFIADQVETMAQEIIVGLSKRYTKPSEQKLLFCALCTAVGGMLGIVEGDKSELSPEDIPEIVSPYVLLGVSRTLENRDQGKVFFDAANDAMGKLALKTENVEMTGAEFRAEDAFHGFELKGKPN